MSAKGLPAVLREWAGNYEEGSFDTEAGLMVEAAEAIDGMLAALKAVDEMFSRPGAINKTTVRDMVRAAISRAEGEQP